MPVVITDPDERPEAKSIRLAIRRWKEIEEIRAYASEKSGKNYSLTEVVDYLTERAVDLFWKDEGGKPKKR